MLGPLYLVPDAFLSNWWKPVKRAGFSVEMDSAEPKEAEEFGGLVRHDDATVSVGISSFDDPKTGERRLVAMLMPMEGRTGPALAAQIERILMAGGVKKAESLSARRGCTSARIQSPAGGHICFAAMARS
jgi:hypothetical protein